jgi:23S rRNA pseudouridine2605 synthase
MTELGCRADPATQVISVDGQAIDRPQRVYYAVNKPTGVVSTNSDPAGRPRVVDLVPSTRERLFPVGRLDLYSAGLILLTNDGELANRLTHPRYGVSKRYRVLVVGEPAPEVFEQLKRGVHLAEGVARVDDIFVHLRRGKSTTLDIVLSEGRNREIRRILAQVGHKVLELLRIGVGPVRLGKLPPGGYRRLTHSEVEALRRVAQKGRG